MAASKGKTKNPQVGPSWGVLLGLAGLPVLALLAKLFPGQTLIWEVVGALCLLWAGISLYKYLTVSPARSGHGHDAAHQSSH